MDTNTVAYTSNEILFSIKNNAAIYPKECAPGHDRAICTPMFIAALFTIAKPWKQPRCSTTDEWIKKM
jgi:hypothetical protein